MSLTCREAIALKTLRRTIHLVGRAADVEMPEEMKRRLRSFLSDRR